MHTTLYYTILYYTVLQYCILMLYYAVLYYVMLYCTIQYSICTQLDDLLISMYKTYGHKVRMPGKFQYIFEYLPPAHGWQGATTQRDLRVGWNASAANTRLFVDKTGNPHPQIGSAITAAVWIHAGVRLTITQFRKEIETEEARALHGDPSLVNFACDHTRAVAERCYVQDTTRAVLDTGSRWDKKWKLDLPVDIFETATATTTTPTASTASTASTTTTTTTPTATVTNIADADDDDIMYDAAIYDSSITH